MTILFLTYREFVLYLIFKDYYYVFSIDIYTVYNTLF